MMSMTASCTPPRPGDVSTKPPHTISRSPSSPSPLDVPLPATPPPGEAPSYQSDSPRPSASSGPPSPSPSYRPVQRDHAINRDALSLVLLFNGPSGPSIQNNENTAPPAFFPQQRVSFSPRLRIANRSGLMLAGRPGEATHDREHVCSMLLGVIGVVETLQNGTVKSKRILADFVTDLTSGVNIWRRDADACVAKRRQGAGLPPRQPEPDGSQALPPGTYVLPLSMRIPACEKLPPSYESTHFRLRYTMTLALLSRKANEPITVTPSIVRATSVPFHILPSTLPSLPPSLPSLTYEERKPGTGLMSGLYRSLAGSYSPTEATSPISVHAVVPSLPTSHFSPGAIVPLTLRVQSKPLSPNSDLYVRVSLVRKTYVRDSTVAIEVDNEFGLPDDLVWEQWCRSEEVISSRWAYIPCEHRSRGASLEKPFNSELVMRDIALSVGLGPEGWQHGYSTCLDMSPASKPIVDPSRGSWFSPTVHEIVTHHAKDAERHLHVSARFYLSVEVGFHTVSPTSPQRLGELLAERKAADPRFVLPKPTSFTKAACPGVNPFPGEVPPSSSSSSTSSASSSPVVDSSPPRFKSSSSWERSPASMSTSFFGRSTSGGLFPGVVRELLIPVTIGSVAEPAMECVAGRRANDVAVDGTSRTGPSDREEIEESVSERAERIGDDGEEPWLVPPPTFVASLRAPPAYV